MNTGLTTKQWAAISEPWSPTCRAIALELLIWLWEHRTPLPAAPKTLQRLSRVDDGRAFRQAWTTLESTGIFVAGTHGYTCPLQDAARGVQEARSRAGKQSAAVRRSRTARIGVGVPDVGTGAPPVVRTGATPPSYPQPVENLLKTSGNLVEKGVSPVEIGPPQTPPLSPGTYVRTSVPEQEHGPPAAGAAFLSDLERNPNPILTSPNLDTVALHVATFVLAEALTAGTPELKWDDFRDRATAAVEKLYELPRTAPKVDQTDLTYRLWDETFLGAYRDRFTTTKTAIKLAPDA